MRHSCWLSGGMLWRAKQLRGMPSSFLRRLCDAAAAAGEKGSRWAELPAVPPKHGMMMMMMMKDELTAGRWMRKCCPHLSHSLLQKLFRLRQIRILLPASQSHEIAGSRFRRVRKEEHIGEGTILYLPKSVSSSNVDAKQDLKEGKVAKLQRRMYIPTLEDSEEIRNLVIHMDEHVIAINKPPGLAVQGGVGISRSLDMLLGPALSFKYADSPKLVHRLDKQTSGIMVLGRTCESTALLHSLFRAKTASTISDCKASLPSDRGLERKYLALVIGTTNQKRGRITAPLKKVVLDGGKSDAVLVADDLSSQDSVEAITEYEVLGPSVFGCTWLELHPLTGRKHQLRVHCAEALGMPIMGDYKYGRQVHEKWQSNTRSIIMNEANDCYGARQNDSTETEGTPKHHSQTVVEGSVASPKPLLHLHSHMLTIPKIKELAASVSSRDSFTMGKKAFLDKLRLIAPLPKHMKASWNLLPPPCKSTRFSE